MVDTEQVAFLFRKFTLLHVFFPFFQVLLQDFASNLLLKFHTFCCTLEPTGASREFLVETNISNEVTFSGFNWTLKGDN